MKNSFAFWLIAAAIGASFAHAASVEDLLTADRAFDRMAQEQGVREAFLSFVGDDPAMLSQGLAPITGDEGVRAFLSKWPDGIALTWEPKGGRIATSGDLGYTWGVFESRGSNSEGVEVVQHGKYVTVWALQEDGSWKWIVDIGNENPEPEP